MELFYVSKFEEKLDTKINLIGFENGVYDLEKGEFRDGVSEDYISFCTNINYIKYDNDDEEIHDVRNFLKQVLPKKNVREYVVTLLSSFLSGHTGNEKFHIWTGCHAVDTPILMFDGTTKLVQDININDKLMGSDSKPRNVLKLKRGESDMYEVSGSKFNKFTVNGGHILCLKATNTIGCYNSVKESRVKIKWQEYDLNGFPINKCINLPYKSESRIQYKKNIKYYENIEEALEQSKLFIDNLSNKSEVIKNGDVVEIPVVEYLKRKNVIGERNYYLYSNPIEFNEQDLDIDPYILGYWLGDGISQNIGISTMEEEIVEYFDDYCKELKKSVYNNGSKANTIIYTSKHRDTGDKYYNPIYDAFKNNNLLNNKHIPHKFKCNSEQNRLELLAGIIDSDGHYQPTSKQFEITLKNEKLIDDIEYLCKSLGFWCNKKSRTKSCMVNGEKFTGTYFQLIIYGDIFKVPVKLERKQPEQRIINKNNLKFSFKINKVEDNNYYGFTVDSNHRYYSGDFIVHHNCGGNGKSKLIELFEMGFGDYCCKLPITIITRKRGDGEAASPFVARTKGKRFACLQEPETNEEINVGLMKELTGGDKIAARSLNKEPFEFKPQFKMVLTCNYLPNVSSNDRGTWRRIRVVEFISKFVENPDPEEPYEFPIDEDLGDKLEMWTEAFMSLLLEYHKIYRKMGIKEPSDVKKQTEEYQNESDNFKQFQSAKIVELDDYDGEGLHIDVAWKVYTDWFKQAYTNNKCPTRKEFKDNMIKRYGKPDKGTTWYGLSYNQTDKHSFINDESELDI
jgi:P4 family phage/plasmid primase-like protien